MTKLLPIAAALLTTFALNAQTTLFSEDFNGNTNQFTMNTADMGSSTAGYNDWIVNNSYTGGTGTIMCLSFPFTFTVNNTAQQPNGITGAPTSKYMHITSDAAASSGITNGCYMAADGLCNFDEYYFTKMTTPINTVGYSNTTLSFWWLCGGSATAYGEVYYSTDGGITWNAGSGQYLNQGSAWQQQSYYNSNFDNQASLLIGFRFVNTTATSGADPGFCLDDIMISGQLGMGISSSVNFTEMSAFPNPANDVLTLKSNMNSDQLNVTITDITGSIIRCESYRNSSQIEISTAELAAGCYYITAEAGEQKSTLRFAVTH